MSYNKINEREIELFESQSPHQLAVTAATAESKSDDAMSALDRMTDQRDQLARQLKDATEQLEMAELLLVKSGKLLNKRMWQADDRKVLVETINDHFNQKPIPPKAL